MGHLKKKYSVASCVQDYSKIIRKHGLKYQFGSTPGVGCQNGSFTIKKMLHLGYNHNVPTFLMFANLVKAFDTSNHKLRVEILKNYGCPPPQIRFYKKEDLHGQQCKIDNRKDRHIHTFRSVGKTRIHRCIRTLLIRHDGICRDNRKRMGEK